MRFTPQPPSWNSLTPQPAPNPPNTPPLPRTIPSPTPKTPNPSTSPPSATKHPPTHPPRPQVKARLQLHKEKASTSNPEDYLPDGIDRRLAEAEAAEERERAERKRAKKEAKRAAEGGGEEAEGGDPDMMAMMGFGGFGSSKK